jgi:hypothetical protein
MFRLDLVLALLTAPFLVFGGLFLLPRILHGYGDAGIGIAALALVVPILLFSSAFGNLLITNGRSGLTIGRHVAVSLTALIGVLALPQNVMTIVTILGLSEIVGCLYYILVRASWGLNDAPHVPEIERLRCVSQSSTTTSLLRASTNPRVSSASNGSDRSPNAA